MKKTFLMLLAVGSVRIISDTHEEELFDATLEANDWEAEEGKHIFEFQVGDAVDTDEQWALDISGFVAYVSTVEEFVEALNLELELNSASDEDHTS